MTAIAASDVAVIVLIDFRATKNRAWKQFQWDGGLLSWAVFGALLLLSAEAADICSAGCTCSPDGTRASCFGLRSIPRGLSPSLRSLEVSYHSITEIGNYAFSGLDKLEDLRLTGGKLSEVSHNAFSSLKELRSLNLSENELNVIPRDAFSECPKLLYLDLSRNALALPSRGPILVSESLSVLDMSGCRLSKLPDRGFSRLPALRELRLRGNANLESVADCDLHPIKHLTFLDVDPGVRLTADCSHQDDTTRSSAAFGHSPTGRSAKKEFLPDELLTYRNIAYISILSTSVLVGVAAGLCLAIAWKRRHRTPRLPQMVEKHGYVYIDHSQDPSFLLPRHTNFGSNTLSSHSPTYNDYEYIREPIYGNSQYSARSSQSFQVPSVHGSDRQLV